MREGLLNATVGILWLIVLIYVVVRIMESRAFEYSMKRTENGLVFEYRLGVYSGRVEMVRDGNAIFPTYQQVMGGWKFKFPIDYTLMDMCLFTKGCIKKGLEASSHSKDLLIFDQVANQKRDSLVCINGAVFLYDNADHKPY